MTCEQPSFLMNAEVVWIEGGASIEPSDDIALLGIREVSEKLDITPRALRFYESKGLIAPRRDGLIRMYGQADIDRIVLILKAKKLGFTLSEICQMIAAQDGHPTANGLKLSRDKCMEQIDMFERQLQQGHEALAELRRIYTMLNSRAAEAVR